MQSMQNRKSSKASLATSYFDQGEGGNQNGGGLQPPDEDQGLDDSFSQQVKKAKTQSALSESLQRIKG